MSEVIGHGFIHVVSSPANGVLALRESAKPPSRRRLPPFSKPSTFLSVTIFLILLSHSAHTMLTQTGSNVPLEPSARPKVSTFLPSLLSHRRCRRRHWGLLVVHIIIILPFRHHCWFCRKVEGGREGGHCTSHFLGIKSDSW